MPKVQVNGIEMNYETLGTGPLLTILGGLGDSARNWSIVAQNLAKNFTVVLIDNRGSGYSEKAKPPYSIEEMTQDTVSLFEELKIERTHILGFSMGGMIAQELSINHAHFVDKLILVSSSPSKEKFSASDLVKKTLLNYEHSPEHYGQTYKLLFSESFQKKYSDQTFIRFQMSKPVPQPKECFLGQLQAVKEFNSIDRIEKIEAPTLILVGDADSMSPVEGSRYLHENIRDSKIKTYENVGHVPQSEKSKEFLQDVTQFLTGAPQ